MPPSADRREHVADEEDARIGLFATPGRFPSVYEPS
jgi:hypothetical protein